jgi:hypothetical protein
LVAVNSSGCFGFNGLTVPYQVNGNSGLPSSINPVFVEVEVALRLRVGVLVLTVAVVDVGCVLLGLTGT